ncbi:MAG: glycosyltransferase family 39 protein [Deltaproteobacteria bacterium]|nr:glycosyltransferase family 39 protein [Deltaproteobacteria bacterium]
MTAFKTMYPPQQAGREGAQDVPEFLGKNSRVTFLLIIFILYAGIRLASFVFVFHERNLIIPNYYSELGISLMQQDRYSIEKKDEGLIRAPGYPVYFTIIYSLFGIKPGIALFLQLLLSGFIPLLIFFNAERLFGETIARTAALVSVVEPVSIIYSNLLLSETLFVIPMLISSLFLIEAVKRGSLSRLLVAAVCTGIAAYFRAVMFYMPFMYIAIYLLLAKQSAKKRIVHIGAFAGVFVVVIAPWIIRNYVRYGYTGFCGIQDINLYYYRATGVAAQLEKRPFLDVQMEFYNAVPKGLSTSKEFSFYRDRAMSIILNHPLVYLKVAIRGAVNLLLAPERYGVYMLSGHLNSYRLSGFLWDRFSIKSIVKKFASPSPLILCILIYQVLFTFAAIALALFGILVALRKYRYAELIIVLSILCYFIGVSSGPEADARMRIPILPYGLILSAVALNDLYQKMHLKEPDRKMQ